MTKDKNKAICTRDDKFKGHALEIMTAEATGLDFGGFRYAVVNTTLGRIGEPSNSITQALKNLKYLAEVPDYDFGDFDEDDLQ